VTPTIEALGLKTRYGRTQALDGLDPVTERGHVVAILGPNGAGKSTFVRAVATVLAGGARLFEGVGPEPKLELVRAIDAPGVTHVKYRVGR
jgi:ABC-type multidrug transport system ATPase subunit